jgi:beta-lactamase class C
MLRFIEANLQINYISATLQRALLETQTGHFQAGAMTQALVWERYPYPVELKQLLAGNSEAMAYEATPTTSLNAEAQPAQEQSPPAAWINKTGSTNGFAAYVAFVPSKKIGIVILANKNYPVAARVTAAHQIVTQLDK